LITQGHTNWLLDSLVDLLYAQPESNHVPSLSQD
jgi:hypothetical protein